MGNTNRRARRRRNQEARRGASARSARVVALGTALLLLLFAMGFCFSVRTWKKRLPRRVSAHDYSATVTASRIGVLGSRR
jgi:hypothetical protein